MSESTENFEGQENEAKVYELGYLLVPFIASEELSANVSKVFKDLISSLGGEVTTELEPELIPLAYTVGKLMGGKRSRFNDAYFGALKFKLEPGQISALKEGIDKSDLVLRYLLLSLPKGSEKEPLKKRLVIKREERAIGREETEFLLEKKEEEVKEPKEESKEQMTTEEMDQEIDNLLTEKSV